MSEHGDFTPAGLLSDHILRANEIKRIVVVYSDLKGGIHVSWSNMQVTTVMGMLEIAKQSAYEELDEPGERKVDED